METIKTEVIANQIRNLLHPIPFRNKQFYESVHEDGFYDLHIQCEWKDKNQDCIEVRIKLLAFDETTHQKSEVRWTDTLTVHIDRFKGATHYDEFQDIVYQTENFIRDLWWKNWVNKKNC